LEASVVLVFLGFVISGAIALLLARDENQTASRCCRVFFNSILSGLSGVLVGFMFDCAGASRTWNPGSPPFFALGWLVGVNLVFIHQLIYLWNEHHEP
jgi:uncharacterized membrane protein HdeD (DUF308 family)